MKCTRDGLKHLSDVLEKIQLVDLEGILGLRVDRRTGAVALEHGQCRGANANSVSLFTASLSLRVWKTPVEELV